MQDRNEVTILLGAEVVFRLGGLHLMLIELHEKPRKGVNLTLALEFEHADSRAWGDQPGITRPQTASYRSVRYRSMRWN
ncbi:MAG TPA: hypothetical protein DIW51_06005 [Rhodospirillaceae bacterium]|uniref:Uncharacterized protein n=1 Tax=Hyphomonas atlantica TaxID=1280948 RepID=A0A356W398_9PROT|nr:hypothetical protein [Magnetovibrio sp.]MBB89361.1 hypothetical protein [Magnetovibrio sp.]HBQ47445.1 hypothetical protein [Hyphomonas atlantica]HBT40943.1 hypothetical protein [Rhodospirillaceae bacterium]HCS69508.1 hypothetical protein [Rhodospirillaceae bacterium]